MTDLRTYSRSRVGEVWTEADHIHLVSTLDKIDRLIQELHNLQQSKCDTAANAPAAAEVAA